MSSALQQSSTSHDIGMPPVTRSQVRRPYQTALAPFPDPQMAQRFMSTRLGNVRTTRASQAGYTTSRGASQIQPSDVPSDESSEDDTADNSNDGQSSNDSDDGGIDEEQTMAENNARTAKALRHLTLVIAPDPIEDYAADALQRLPYGARRTDEGIEFHRIVDILVALSLSSNALRSQLLDHTPMRLTGTRWGESMLRRFTKSLVVIKSRFRDWTRGALPDGGDVVDTGNALRNWIAGMTYVLPEGFQHMSAQTQGGFVERILDAVCFVVQADTDIRSIRATPDYASQPQTQNNLYYNVIANGKGDAFGMQLLDPLRVVIRTDTQIELIRYLWDTIQQKHLLAESDKNRPRPSARFFDILGSLNVYINSLR